MAEEEPRTITVLRRKEVPTQVVGLGVVGAIRRMGHQIAMWLGLGALTAILAVQAGRVLRVLAAVVPELLDMLGTMAHSPVRAVLGPIGLMVRSVLRAVGQAERMGIKQAEPAVAALVERPQQRELMVRPTPEAVAVAVVR